MRLPRRHGRRTLPGAASSDANKPVAVWTSVVECRTLARPPLLGRGAPGRQPRVDEPAHRGQGAQAVGQRTATRCACRRGRDGPSGGAKAALTIVLVPFGKRVAVLTLTSNTGFNPYPQARDLMRRMLGLKPVAARRRLPTAAARRAGRGRPLRAPLGQGAPRDLFLEAFLEALSGLTSSAGRPRRPPRAPVPACRSTA